MSKPRIFLLAVLLTALAAAAYWSAPRIAGTARAPAKAPAPVPVVTARATLADVPVAVEVVGRAEAYESVALKARVDGQVISVRFSEGQSVSSGEVLIELDPGDFEARLSQARASLLKDEAILAKARVDVDRYVALKARGFVSEEKVNEMRTALAAAAATVDADRAAVDLARRQLSYATIRAPFAGIVGARLVFPGTAVKVNDTVLAVVNRVRPLFVAFSVPEKHLAALRRAMDRGDARATVRVPGAKTPPAAARVRFIDNTVDSSTGTIQVKAVLDNEDQQLTPGQFLDVSLVLDTLVDAVVVPTEAVQQGPEGAWIYVVRPDRTVEARRIEVITTQRGIAAIAKGLAKDETVVTDGQLRLAPGLTVDVPDAGNADRDGAPTAPER
ncbi:efflux RND transporter periplasmic adaptor subunit [Accumulibacter sp.]|uniref:efflux RND transporter periplasmic adaptor subunit n=1 Tax=Accumulibacter sp. TaxID=2053492 RepID=UPI0025F7A45B|nr:efflux RND transporter periplasmic adaptor subunit [Accumulibacter sp.]MCM8594523.1 efflux RND transporter periplasmic adaptor subunit [Accumulibacter sp.]MCM8626789.1 efflux RND transporter periplasmic adaptor subunit [Accumulibacter sp.]MDS4048669.1 efflux RND transporter periplasmic adaptor subunit [Accumulibacter sp.]